MKRFFFFVCIVTLVGVNAFCGELRISDLVDVERISEKLGDGWRRDAGLVLEGEEDISKMSEPRKSQAKRALENLKPKGIIGFGHYSYTRTKAPFNNVMILVQKFSSAEKAAAYGEMKYGGEKQKSRYKKTVTKSEVTYDNLLWNRRVVVHGRFIATAEHAQKGDLHEEIIKECIDFDGKVKKDIKESPKLSPAKKDKVHEFKVYGFSVKGSGKLVTLDTAVFKHLAERVNLGVITHAKTKGIDAGKVKSGILFYQSLHKIDAGKDNPNITLSVENNWLGTKDPSGKDYLELMDDRIKTFKMPSEFKGKMQKRQINGQLFYVQDAVNTRIKGADTKQKYYATCHKGNFIVFVISYRDEKSETFKLLESVVQSFCTLDDSKKNISGKLNRSYVIENGFLVDRADGMSSYRKIFNLLAANNIDIMSLKKDDPVVQLSGGDKEKLIGFFIQGARSKKLGIKKPGWMRSLSGNYDPELQKVIKICYLIKPFIEQEGGSKELAIAFMAFGEQLCEYNDRVIELMGIGCKHKSIAFLIDNDQGDDKMLSKKYKQMETEIEKDFKEIKERMK